MTRHAYWTAWMDVAVGLNIFERGKYLEGVILLTN